MINTAFWKFSCVSCFFVGRGLVSSLSSRDLFFPFGIIDTSVTYYNIYAYAKQFLICVKVAVLHEARSFCGSTFLIFLAWLDATSTPNSIYCCNGREAHF